MRRARALSLVVVAALLACAGARVVPDQAPPKASAETAVPEDTPGEVLAEARILRAEDRRVVDDDLRALLNGPDEGTRARAVLALGRIADPATRPLLERALADPAPRVRAEAAFGLGLLGDPAATGALAVAAADPDPSVRASVAEALGRLPTGGGAAAIGPLLDDPAPEVAAAASLSAWKFPEPSFAVEALVRNNRHADPRVRFASLYAIARLTSATTLPSSGAQPGTLPADTLRRLRDALLASVSAPESEMRLQVARGLANPSRPEEESALGVYARDEDPRVRIAALRSLAVPGADLDPAFSRALTDRNVHVIAAAIEGMGKIGGTVVADRLLEGIDRERRTWLREAAFVAVAKAAPDLVPRVAQTLASSPEPLLRAAVGKVLVGRSEPEALDFAVSLLNDPSPRVVAAVVPIAAKKEGPLVERLAPAIRSQDPVVRAAVAEAVGERLAAPGGGGDERPTLLTLLDRLWDGSKTDTLIDVRLAVLDAAAKAGREPRAKEMLVRGLGEKEVLLRRRAADRLASVHGEDRAASVGAATDLPLAHYVEVVRWSSAPIAALVQVHRPGFPPARFSLRLDAKDAPLVVKNFVDLANEKFYDGNVVHRVVPNFVVQDGDPRGDGYGGPGWAIRDAFGHRPFLAGAVGMASDGKDTAGSQWFVTLSAQPHLDGRYTVFGEVTQNLAGVVAQIAPGDYIVGIRPYQGDGTEPLDEAERRAIEYAKSRNP